MLDLGIETVSHNCFKVHYDMAWHSLDKPSSSKLKTPKKNLHVYHITGFSVYLYMILTLQYCECEIS